MAERFQSDSTGCRLCGDPLQEYDMEHQICSICTEYAHQLGARNEKAFLEVVEELIRDPLFAGAPR